MRKRGVRCLLDAHRAFLFGELAPLDHPVGGRIKQTGDSPCNYTRCPSQKGTAFFGAHHKNWAQAEIVVVQATIGETALPGE